MRLTTFMPGEGLELVFRPPADYA